MSRKDSIIYHEQKIKNWKHQEFPIKFESTRITGENIIFFGYLNRSKCIFI